MWAAFFRHALRLQACHSTSSSPATATAIPTAYSMNSKNSATSLFILSLGVWETPQLFLLSPTSHPWHPQGSQLRNIHLHISHSVPPRPLCVYSPTPPTPRQPTPSPTPDTRSAFLDEGSLCFGSSPLLSTLCKLPTIRLPLPRTPFSSRSPLAPLCNTMQYWAGCAAVTAAPSSPRSARPHYENPPLSLPLVSCGRNSAPSRGVLHSTLGIPDICPPSLLLVLCLAVLENCMGRLRLLRAAVWEGATSAHP